MIQWQYATSAEWLTYPLFWNLRASSSASIIRRLHASRITGKSDIFPKMWRHPITKWAQRSDRVYLSIELPDAKDVKLELHPEGRFVFSAQRDGVPYGIDIELFDKVNVKESKSTVNTRLISYTIKKAEKKWWDRILKQEGKPPAFLKIDWDKWVDEEDEEEKIKNLGLNNPSKKSKKRKEKFGHLHKLIDKLKLNCLRA